MQDKKTDPQQYVGIDPRLMPYVADDEISLIELWLILVKRWKTVAIITLVISSVALAYVLVGPKKYEVELTIYSPELSDIKSLQAIPISLPGEGSKTGSSLIDNSYVFNTVKKYLESQITKKDFFKSFFSVSAYSSEIVRSKLNNFNENSSMRLPKKGDITKNFIIYTLSWPDAEEAVQLANAYIKYVEQTATSALIKDAKYFLDKELVRTGTVITSKRSMVRGELDVRLSQLREALLIAQKLGIKERQESTQYNIQKSTNSSPEYLRGSLALAEEIEAIKNRHVYNEKTYTDEFSIFEKELNKLREHDFDSEPIKVMILDEPASVESLAVKPNAKLVIIIAVILGMMLGVFMAFFLNFVEPARKEIAQKKISE